MIEVKKMSSLELEELLVLQWPIWEKEISVFDWYYDQLEECYILEGKVRVIPENDPLGAVEFGSGDFVVFPKGLSCRWEITEAVRKHYRFI